MSTNINSNTPTPPPSHGVSSSGISGGFQSGNAANADALLLAIAAMMEIMSKKNDLFQTEARAENTAMQSSADAQRELGESEATEYAGLAAASFASGIFGLGSEAIGSEPDLEGQQSQINESNAFIKNLGEQPKANVTTTDGTTTSETEETTALTAEESEATNQSSVSRNSDEDRANQRESDKTRLKEMLNEIESGNYKMYEGSGKNAKVASLKDGDAEVYQRLNDDERLSVTKAFKSRVDGMQSKLNADTASSQEATTKRRARTQALQSLASAGGQANQSAMKVYEADENAQKTEFSSAQEGFKSVKQETERQSDSDLQQAIQLSQEITDIDKSNNGVLSA